MFFLSKEDELIFSSNIKALYFYAQWMPYHNKMLIMIDKVEQKYKNITFLAIDVESFKGLCKRFSVESIPTVVITNLGTEIKRLNGFIMTSAFISAFTDICNLRNTINGEDNEQEARSNK